MKAQFGMFERAVLFVVLFTMVALSIATAAAVVSQHGTAPNYEVARAFEIGQWALLAALVVALFGRPVITYGGGIIRGDRG